MNSTVSTPHRIGTVIGGVPRDLGAWLVRLEGTPKEEVETILPVAVFCSQVRALEVGDRVAIRPPPACEGLPPWHVVVLFPKKVEGPEETPVALEGVSR